MGLPVEEAACVKKGQRQRVAWGFRAVKRCSRTLERARVCGRGAREAFVRHTKAATSRVSSREQPAQKLALQG